MANSARTQPGTGTSRKEKEVNPLDDVLVFYEKNKKTISTATTIIVGAIVLYFGYTKLYKAPAEEKGGYCPLFPQMYLQADSVNMALNGDGKNLGFSKIAKKYDLVPLQATSLITMKVFAILRWATIKTQ